jgi:hypothetical protein
MKRRKVFEKVLFTLVGFAALILTIQSAFSASSKDTEVDKIKKVWISFVKKLSAKDIEGALEYVVEERKERFREAFNAIKDRLPKEFLKKEEIQINEINGNMATGENIVRENGGVYSYPVIFIKERGQWKIQSF